MEAEVWGHGGWTEDWGPLRHHLALPFYLEKVLFCHDPRLLDRPQLLPDPIHHL